MEDWGTERSERVDFCGVAKRLLRSSLPEYTIAGSGGGAVWLTKPIGAEAEAYLVLDKSLPFAGKGFTIELGVRHPPSAKKWTANIGRLFGTTSQRFWVYANRTEAERAVSAAMKVYGTVEATWEKVLQEFFSPWPNALPDRVERRGAITACEAYDEAMSIVLREFPDARFIRLDGTVSADGKLPEGSEWRLHFHSPQRDVSLDVTVPSVGAIRLLDDDDQYRNVNSRRLLREIDSEWIDSSQAITIAENHGGRDRRAQGSQTSIFARLHLASVATPVWDVHYGVVDERGRNDLDMRIAAESGEVLVIE
jgi:hypothetical protein